MKKALVLILAGTALTACSTTDFGPPVVNLERQLVVDSSEVCRPTLATASNAESGGGNSSVSISQASVDNARGLIQNFILVYRCRARETANGRQAFQVPAFLSVVGAAAAVAFGASPDVAIAGTVGSSVFNAGNSYYSPLQQAGIYNSAIDALVCIQTEAVGVEAFVREEEEVDANAAEDGGGEGDSAVFTSAEVQYYDMVKGALFSVELVAARRLMNVGTFDPAGVVAEISALNQEAADNPVPGSPEAAAAAAADEESGGGAADAEDNVRLAIEALRPRLQRCVVRAKI